MVFTAPAGAATRCTPVGTIAGANLHVVPLAAGWAIVAEAAQILVGLRQDAEVEFSGHDGFGTDSTTARIVLRADFGVNDLEGFSVIRPV